MILISLFAAAYKSVSGNLLPAFGAEDLRGVFWLTFLATMRPKTSAKGETWVGAGGKRRWFEAICRGDGQIKKNNVRPERLKIATEMAAGKLLPLTWLADYIVTGRLKYNKTRISRIFVYLE